MGTSCLVTPRRGPDTKPALVREMKARPRNKQKEETPRSRQPARGARQQQEQGRKEGQGPFSGMFVNTEGRRKRNDVFYLPALCGRTHRVPQRESPPCSHPAAPQGAPRERGFHTREGCRAAQACRHWMDPTGAVGGCGNRPSLGSKPAWSMHQSPGRCQTCSRNGCLQQGHGCRAALCSALHFVSEEQAGG